MKDIIKKSLKVFYLMFVANIMSFFLIISFNVITVAVFTEEIGYTAYGTTQENQESVELYTHYFKDGEDTKKQEYEAKGYTITTPSIRSNPSRTTNIVLKLVSCVICTTMVVAILYTEMWRYGDKDRTAVKYKNQKEQKYKGFIVGAFSTSPALLLLIVLTIFKSGFSKTFPLLIYGFLNTYLYDLINLIAGNAQYFGDFALWQIFVILLMLTIIPIACGISYYLGYKSISVSEKLVYKSNKNKDTV